MPQVEKKLKTKKKFHSKFEPSKIKNLVGGAMIEVNGGTEFKERLDFFSQFPYSSKAEEITKMVEETYKETYANRLGNKFIREKKNPTDLLPSMIKKKTLNGKIIDFNLYQKFGPPGGSTKSAKEVFESNFQEYRDIFNPPAEAVPGPRAPPTLDDDDALSDGLGIGFCSNVTSQFGLSGLPLLSFIVSYICNCPNPLYATCICFCVFGSSGFIVRLSRNSSRIASYIPHRFFDGYVAQDLKRRRYR